MNLLVILLILLLLFGGGGFYVGGPKGGREPRRHHPAHPDYHAADWQALTTGGAAALAGGHCGAGASSLHFLLQRLNTPHHPAHQLG